MTFLTTHAGPQWHQRWHMNHNSDIRDDTWTMICLSDDMWTTVMSQGDNTWTTVIMTSVIHHHHHHHHHQSLKCEGHCGTTDNFATSFLHFSQFSTALWDLPNSRPVHSLMLSSHLFLFFRLLLCLARWFWPDLMNRRHDHITVVCVSLQLSDLRLVQLPAGSRDGLPRW